MDDKAAEAGRWLVRSFTGERIAVIFQPAKDPVYHVRGLMPDLPGDRRSVQILYVYLWITSPKCNNSWGGRSIRGSPVAATGLRAAEVTLVFFCRFPALVSYLRRPCYSNTGITSTGVLDSCVTLRAVEPSNMAPKDGSVCVPMTIRSASSCMAC